MVTGVTTLPPPQASQLDYAAAPDARRGKAVRRAVLVGFLLLAAVASLKWLGPAWDRVRLVHYQGRCLAHEAAAGAVVHDDASGRTVGTAADWERFYALFSPPGGRHGATAFLHELRRKDGSRRLVAVEAYALDRNHPATDSLAFSHLAWTVIEPGGLWSPPRSQVYSIWGIPRAPLSSDPLRLYAGQTDPNDASHFTIAYDRAGRPGVIDAWLRADDTLLFEVREAERSFSSARP